MTMKPIWFLLVFFVFGWAYYMVARILMEGSIFNGMRRAVKHRAEESGFFAKIDEMLGCLMCTATEAAIWTLGVATFWLGLHYDLPETVVSSIIGRPAELNTLAQVVLMVMASFAISLAVAGEAWAINVVFEYNRGKYFAAKNKWRRREADLLEKIRRLEAGEGADPTKPYQSMVPMEEFEEIFNSLRGNKDCRRSGCVYMRTECNIRAMLEGLRNWWTITNGDAPGFVVYETILQNAIWVQNELYSMFWARKMRPVDLAYKEFSRQVLDATERQQTT
jgi:hypothetical protein